MTLYHSPEAILFDMDGVFADVSRSYRQAILQTLSSFGCILDEEALWQAKMEGDTNNDWHLTHKLLKRAGKEISFSEVKACFERLYQGEEEEDLEGLWTQERFLGERETLVQLAQEIPLGIVTGRPRADAERFMQHYRIEAFFSSVVCMEDAAPKPSPDPVLLALKQLNVTHAWMIGDTPDDIEAAQKANVIPYGVIAPNEPAAEKRPLLLQAGAVKVFDVWGELAEEWREKSRGLG